jgi:hypothetical protein
MSFARISIDRSMQSMPPGPSGPVWTFDRAERRRIEADSADRKHKARFLLG